MKPPSVPIKMRQLFERIVSLTDRVCSEHLNEQYAELARNATAALCRKRPSPLVKGDINSWACGIIYAIGFVNFLYDRSREPYLSAEQLCDAFDVSKSTGYGKSKVVRGALKMTRWDHKWCLSSFIEDNPFIWMIQVDGLPVDARWLPREIQEVAVRKGLIPYVSTRGKGGD